MVSLASGVLSERHLATACIAASHPEKMPHVGCRLSKGHTNHRIMLVMRLLRTVCLPSFFAAAKLARLFAFSYRTVDAGAPDPGWHIYDALKEFDRMGALKPRRTHVASPWR